MLSDRFIRNAKTGMYADEGGLYLQVYPTGKKSFLLRDQSNGKQIKKVLGQYPAMGLAAAREAVAKRKSGHVTRTLGECFAIYYKHLETQFRDPEQTKRMFEKDVLPEYKDTSLEDVTKATYTDILQTIIKRGSPVMANRLLVQLKRFLAFCHDRGWIEDNPLATVVRRNIGGKEKPKDRNLTDDEITSNLRSLGGCFSPGARWALYGCLLIGQRASEVLEITDQGTVITKMNREHQIPMTPAVRAWIKSRPTELPRDHRVLSHALRRHGADFTPHDLRRTFASRLADLGVAPHVIEKLLDHQMVGVMAVYNRAEYRAERYAAQVLWGRTLSRLRKNNRGA